LGWRFAIAATSQILNRYVQILKMGKTEIEQSFDYLVSKLWTPFKSRGYKKQGNNFRFYSNEGWGKIVNFRKSQWGDKDKISFAVNIGFYLPEVSKFHCGKEAQERFAEASSVVRKRIGDFMPKNHKDWFEVNPSTNIEELYKELNGYFEDLIIPYLDPICSKQDILNILIEGHRSHYMSAQIQTLWANGYKDVAKQQLINELARAKGLPFYLEELNRIQQQMVD